jgi:hypothetical protein
MNNTEELLKRVLLNMKYDSRKTLKENINLIGNLLNEQLTTNVGDYTVSFDSEYKRIKIDSPSGREYYWSPSGGWYRVTYNLGNELALPTISGSSSTLYFGDEYSFYGTINTDIQATIYEMRYKVNLSFAEFQTTTNPTWKKGGNSYITEIALLDSNKDVMVISKMQSPVLRQGIQQFVVKLDL